MEIVFATNNLHKLSEIRSIIPSKIRILSLNEIGFTSEIPEDYDTLEANAEQKVRCIVNKYNCNGFADDTGLEVLALNMRPGVYSARYAGNDANSQNNIDKLLREMSSFKNRDAQFRTVIALILNNNLHLFEGIVKGKIIEKRAGVEGFGYDPIFVPDGYKQTFAEMPAELKNTISHRALATKNLLNFLDTVV